MKKKRFEGSKSRPIEILYIFFLIAIMTFMIILFLSLMKGPFLSELYRFIISWILAMVIIGIFLVLVYLILKRSGEYSKGRYKVEVSDWGIKIIKNRKMYEISAENIERIEIKRNTLIVKPKSYDYFIENSDGMERHNYYYAQEHNMPVTLPLPALSRAERKRLKEAIEEFKRRNGIE